jgi:hypothetical protein
MTLEQVKNMLEIEQIKTLVVILNYNTPGLTNNLYESLAQGADHYDLAIIDNGSDEGKRSKYTTIQLNKNLYFGGGFASALDLFLNTTTKEYDSILLLNSDIVIPDYMKYTWVNALSWELRKGYDLLSPAIKQPVGECHWKQMSEYSCAKPREVAWVDLTAPIISRRLAEQIMNHIKHYGYPQYGWGLEILLGMICGSFGWKAAVSDDLTINHMVSETINQNKDKPDIRDYCVNAEKEQWEYFKHCEMLDQAIALRKWGEEYIPQKTAMK